MDVKNLPVAAAKKSPEQLLARFNRLTRQNWKTGNTVVGLPGTTVRFELDRVRLSSKLTLRVTAILNSIQAAGADWVPAVWSPFTLIRAIRVNLNNGFAPFSLSGTQLAIYNMLMTDKSNLLARAAAGRGLVLNPIASAAGPGGADNALECIVEVPFVLNDRDTYGLLLTQNAETVATVEIDFGVDGDIAPAAAGYTFALGPITVQSEVDTFTIPSDPDSRPDLSMIKVVGATTYPILAAVNTLRIPRGTIIRKMGIYVMDAVGAGVVDAGITTDMELVMNQSDIPYTIHPRILAGKNTRMYGAPLPQGLWSFDFSYQGMVSYGGTRDYIDTERLSQLDLRFGAGAAGTAWVILEQLARVRAS